MVFSLALLGLLTLSGAKGDLVVYDPGRSDQRDYRSAEHCGPKPCVVTQTGAIRFNLPADHPYEVNIWVLHGGRLTPVDYFEKRSFQDYFLMERAFNRTRNKLVWSVIERIESRDIDTFHIYGLRLQYEIEQGDPVIVELVSRNVPSERHEYIFRYYRDGYYVGFDLALLLPLNVLKFPEPNEPLKIRSINIGATLSLKSHKDPERDYSLLESVLLAGHPTLFVGLLSRELARPGQDPEKQADMFVGGGVSFLDFLFIGLGVNLFTEPRIATPFVGFQFRKGIDFIKDLDRSSPAKWDEYLEEETGRERVQGEK